MKLRLSTASACVFCLSVLSFVGMGLAQTQSEGQDIAQKIVSVRLDQVDVRRAVADLFAKVGGKYDLEKEIQGKVTAEMTNVQMESALANILKQVNATWRVRDGIYQIVRKPEAEPIDWTEHDAAIKAKYGEDVRVVLWRLIGRPFSISPEVRGMVKVDEDAMKKRTFEAALQDVLKQVNATVRVENGFMEILPITSQDVSRKVVSLTAQGEDVREVLKKLFRMVGADYTIAVELQGQVTVVYKDVFFRDALDGILKQVDGYSAMEGPVYVLKKRQREVREEPMETVRRGNKIISLSARSADVRDVIRRLFAEHGGQWVIKPEVHGTVTIDAKDSSFANVLSTVLHQVGAGWHVENGIYMIYGTEGTSIRTGLDPTAHPIVLPQRETAVTMTQDNRFIYILRGDELYKVNKSDLKTVAKGRLGQ